MKYKKALSVIVILLLYSIFYFASGGTNTFYHEAVHENQCRILGGTSVQDSNDYGVYTNCSISNKTNMKRFNDASLEAEKHGYNNLMLIENLWLIALLISISIIIK